MAREEAEGEEGERDGTFFYRGGNAHQSSTESDGDRKREGSGWGCHLSSCHCCHPWCLWKAAILCAVWCETRSYKSVPLLTACVRARIRVGECWCAGWMDGWGGANRKSKMLHKIPRLHPLPPLLISKSGAWVRRQEQPAGGGADQKANPAEWQRRACNQAKPRTQRPWNRRSFQRWAYFAIRLRCRPIKKSHRSNSVPPRLQVYSLVSCVDYTALTSKPCFSSVLQTQR